MFFKIINTFLIDNFLDSLLIVKKYVYKNFGSNIKYPV